MILSEKKGKDLFDQLFTDQPLAIVWFTPVYTISKSGHPSLNDFRVGFCNQAACSLLGVEIAEASGINVMGTELMDPVSRTEIYTQCAQVLQTGEPFTFTYHSPKLNRWYVVQRSKLLDGVLSIIQDKTAEIVLQHESEKQNNKLNDQARILDLILNSSVSGVYLLEAVYDINQVVVDFRIIHVNDVLCKISGKSREDLEGRLFSQTFPDGTKQGLIERNAQVLATGIEYHNEFRFVGDGVDRWYDTSVCRATDNKLVISFNDITKLKLATLELEAANAKLKESNLRLREFSQFVSHDLKAPLKKLAYYNDVLRTKLKSDPEVSVYLQKVEKMMTRMNVLINDLLLFSESENLTKSFKSVKLDGILSDIRSDYEALIDQNELTLTVGSLPEVKGDRTLLSQVFRNLISNSIKFRAPQTCAVIAVESDGVILRDNIEYFIVELKDNGIGFEQSHAEKIFEPFQRLNGPDTYEGSGIGLAIVKRVMEKHAGQIEVTSKPGAGTKFTLLFPTSR
jgi:PAS domain S-box-containing protein